MTSRFPHPLDVPPAPLPVDLSPLLRELIEAQGRSSDVLASLAQAVQALTHTVSETPEPVQAQVVAQDTTLQDVMEALGGLLPGAVQLPERLDVEVRNDVTLDPVSLSKLRDMIAEVSVSTKRGRTLIAGGGGGSGKLRLDSGDVTTENPVPVTVGNDPASISLETSTASLTSASPLTISPSVGTNALRLWWVSVIPDPDNTDTGYATVAVGAVEAYRAPALAHRQRFDGAAGEDIVVTIVGDGTFLASVHYLEYTP
jgi:hypothetical protein